MEVDQPCANNDFTPMQGVLSEVASFCQPYVQKLYDSDKSVVIEGLKEIKNFIIGNNKQKSNFIVFGVIRRLLYLIEQNENEIDLKVHCAVILGSLAKGIDTNITNLLDCGILGVMYCGLRQSDLRLYEACIRCVRTIITSPDNQELIFCDPSIIPVLLGSINRSMCVQECTCEIIFHCCKTEQHQNILHEMDAISCLVDLLASRINRVKVKALKAVSAMCYRNKQICLNLLNASIDNSPASEILIAMLSRGEPSEVQINAARCLTYAYRSGASTFDKALIYKKVLPCLVRMCDSSRNIDERVTGATTIAYLIQYEPELQRIALICEQFPLKLASYFFHPSPGDTNNAVDMRRFNYELSRANDMHEAVFLAYAALLSNDEDMRNLVVTETLVTHVVTSLDNSPNKVRIAALQCLLSLSRSVQILRTAFEDLKIWQTLLKVLRRDDVSEKELVVGSALICNMILEFSPCKNNLIQENVLEMLKEWCRQDRSIDLKRNAIWAFLNLTFQATFPLKTSVMKLLDPDTLFMLLTTKDHEVVSKTLGVLSNLLTSSEHIDAIMSEFGDTIMQACVVVLESPPPDEQNNTVYLHALCVLANVAAGDEEMTVRRFLHDKENILLKIIDFLACNNAETRWVAIDCLLKLSSGSAATVVERRAKLREMGVVDKLQRLTVTADFGSSEKIKETLAFLQS